PQVDSTRPDTGLPALQAGAGNAALAAAAASGSLGTVSHLLLRQALYGNGATTQAAAAGEVGVETPQGRAAESLATNAATVPEAGGIRPEVAPMLQGEGSIKPAPTADIPVTHVPAPRATVIPAPTAQIVRPETPVALTTIHDSRPAPGSSPQAEVKAAPAVAAAMPGVPKSPPRQAIAANVHMTAAPETPREAQPSPATAAPANARARVAGTSPAATTAAVAGEGATP